MNYYERIQQSIDYMEDHLAKDVTIEDAGYRIFGYNHPDPSNVDDASELYGYEVCVTIPDTIYEKLEDIPGDFVKGTYDGVKRKVIQGGRYAVFSDFTDGNYMTTDTDLPHLMQTWMQMEQWRGEGKVKAGKHQWVEEWKLEQFMFPAQEIRVCYPIQL